MHFVINLTDPDPATRPTAREALEHYWFQNVCPDTYEQLPANLLQTPIVSRIQLLSPGITPESRLISRDKIAKNMERKGENDIFRWNEITYSPVVPTQQRVIHQMDPSKTEKLQGRDLNKENMVSQNQKVALPQRNPAIGKKITGHLLQNEKQQLGAKQENQKSNAQAVKQEQLFRFSSPKQENQRKLEENKTVDIFPKTLEQSENEAI